MPDKRLSLNQQIALMPVAVPDAVLDFLEDFNYGTSLQTEGVRNAFDPEYLKVSGDALKAELEKLRADLGKLIEVQVEAAGREVPGGFSSKLTFEKGTRGMGLFTKLKERTIFRVVFTPSEFDDAAVKELLKNPPKQG